MFGCIWCILFDLSIMLKEVFNLKVSSSLNLWLKIPQVTTHRMGKKCSMLGCWLQLWQMTRTFKKRHLGLRVKNFVQVLAEEHKGSLLLIQQVSYMGREASPVAHALPHGSLQPPSMPAHGQRATLGSLVFSFIVCKRFHM